MITIYKMVKTATFLFCVFYHNFNTRESLKGQKDHIRIDSTGLHWPLRAAGESWRPRLPEGTDILPTLFVILVSGLVPKFPPYCDGRKIENYSPQTFIWEPGYKVHKQGKLSRDLESKN